MAVASTVPQRADDVCRGEKGQGNKQLGFLLSGHCCLPPPPPEGLVDPLPDYISCL